MEYYTTIEEVKADFVQRCTKEGRLVSDHIRMKTSSRELIREGIRGENRATGKDWVVPVDGSFRDGYVKFGINEKSELIPLSISTNS